MQTLRTTTEDGLVLVGQLFGRQGNTKAILHIHGMAGSLYYNYFYPPMQKLYPSFGFDFLVVEHRGTHSITVFETADGGSKILGNAYEKFEDSFYDIDAWIKKLLDLGYEEIVLQAHSLGPSKILNYWWKAEGKIKRKVKALVLLSPVDMVALAKSYDGYEKFLKEAEGLVKEGKGKELLKHDFWGEYKLSAETLLDFFAGDNPKANIFPYHNPEDQNWGRFKEITIPVFAATGTKDLIDNPYFAMDLLKEKLINSPKVKTVVFKGADHSFEGFEKKLVEEIVLFLKEI